MAYLGVKDSIPVSSIEPPVEEQLKFFAKKLYRFRYFANVYVKTNQLDSKRKYS